MNDKWNSYVFLKTKGSWTDTDSVKQWPGISAIWSLSGDWDWCIQLDQANSSPEKAEAFVSKLREKDWVVSSETRWWRKVWEGQEGKGERA